MKAIDLAKKLYSELSKDDIEMIFCPDLLEMVDKSLCNEAKEWKDNENIELCTDWWNQEVSEAREKWLLETKEMCKLVCP